MILAIDIGGTYIKHGFVKTAEVFENGKFKTIFDFSELCRKIGELVTPDTEKICISSGGFWEKDGASLGYETIPEMKDKNLVGVLKEKYGVPVTVQNDARCALLCEKEYGALKNCKNGVLFVLGSSVGTAVLINGALYEGSRKRSAMFFKMPEKTEPYQYELFSNTVRQCERCKKEFSLEKCNMQDVEIFALCGEIKAQEILKNYAMAIAKKLLFARLVYDPEKIVVGGGIANSDKIFSDVLSEYEKLLLLTGERNDVPIVKTSFGENSNLIGAALVETEN